MNKQLLPNDQWSNLITFLLVCDNTNVIVQNGIFTSNTKSESGSIVSDGLESAWGLHEPPRHRKIYLLKFISWS